MSLFRIRVTSFAMGFAWAAGYGAYLLRSDLKSGHEQLLGQARALARGRLCARGQKKTTGVSRACFYKLACMLTLAVWCPLIRLLHAAHCILHTGARF